VGSALKFVPGVVAEVLEDGEGFAGLGEKRVEFPEGRMGFLQKSPRIPEGDENSDGDNGEEEQGHEIEADEGAVGPRGGPRVL